jgi:YEATS domain-containing protein 4
LKKENARVLNAAPRSPSDGDADAAHGVARARARRIERIAVGSIDRDRETSDARVESNRIERRIESEIGIESKRDDDDARRMARGADERDRTQAIIVGTIAHYLGKRADEYHSHRWTVYVRGLDGEDLSHCVESVEFALHPSFDEPTRVLTQAPYEVTETGWGEFDIGVKITFSSDCGEARTVTTTTPLKLFPSAEEIARHGPQTTKKPLIKERYEEIVFHECDGGFYKRMKSHAWKRAPKSAHDDAWSSFKDKPELVGIYAAREVTKERIKILEQQLEVLESIDANA